MKYWRELLCILGGYTLILVIMSIFLVINANSKSNTVTEGVTGYGDIGANQTESIGVTGYGDIGANQPID